MVDLNSPFYPLYELLLKSLGEQPTFEVEFDKAAKKQMDGLGFEGQRRVQKLVDRVHGTPLHQPNPSLTRIEPQQLKAMGLPHTSRNHYTVGDYRLRMMAELQGNKLRIFDVRTREDSKHSGRTRR
jgi:mRNA-degrading endonuclease RelE of RelBE toxin-antitoxin system